MTSSVTVMSDNLPEYDTPKGLETPVVNGLSETENKYLDKMFAQLRQTRPDNYRRSRYYDGEIPLRDLGYAMPPKLKNRAAACVGWAAKSVDMLAVRSVFDGFTFEDGNDDRLKDVVTDNDLRGVYRQAVTSELTHCCVFFTVTKGDTSQGDPEVLITSYSAINATALYDVRKRRIYAGLALVDVGDDNLPSAWNLYTDDATIEIYKGGGKWNVTRHPNGLGRPQMEVMAYNSTIDRPFGRPRINHIVRGLADKARVINGLISLASELFTVPKIFLLGTDGTTFAGQDKYETIMGSIFEIEMNSEGEKPDLGQLSQMTMEPLASVYRLLASEFSAETDIPLQNLGILTDNPTSAEALYAGQEGISILCERMNEQNGMALENIARMAIAIKENKSLAELTEDERRVHALWEDTAHISAAARADATLKQWTVLSGGNVPDVLLEKMGWSDSDRMRYREQIENDMNTSAIDAIAEAVRGSGSYYRSEGDTQMPKGDKTAATGWEVTNYDSA